MSVSLTDKDDAAAVTIRNTETGEVRVFMDDTWANAGEYHYSDGNGSCDCNRSIYFARAAGMDPHEAYMQHDDCGDGKYHIDSVVYRGELVWREE